MKTHPFPDIPHFSPSFFLDSEKLVILRDTLGSGRGTSLDLAGVESYGEVCNSRICGLTGSDGEEIAV